MTTKGNAAAFPGPIKVCVFTLAPRPTRLLSLPCLLYGYTYVTLLRDIHEKRFAYISRYHCKRKYHNYISLIERSTVTLFSS